MNKILTIIEMDEEKHNFLVSYAEDNDLSVNDVITGILESAAAMIQTLKENETSSKK